MTEFQLTRPTKGPRIPKLYFEAVSQISTHAAHEGAAWWLLNQAYEVDISTHAAHEGAARVRVECKSVQIHFNSRGPRRGRDGGYLIRLMRSVFQLTRPTKGPRRAFFHLSGLLSISTHAAHEGAAGAVARMNADNIISTHAAHEGAAADGGHVGKRLHISTHAAHEGAASQGAARPAPCCHFNSRGPRRGRVGFGIPHPERIDFNSRGPRRGRGAHRPRSRRRSHFNSRGPRRGRANRETTGYSMPYFNSRGPRRGRAQASEAQGLAELFQLTRPTKGPRRLGRLSASMMSFQLTRPTKGPRCALTAKRLENRDFNSRGPRRGREPSV